MLPDEQAPPLKGTETKQTLHVPVPRLLPAVEPSRPGSLLSIQLDGHQNAVLMLSNAHAC